MVTELTIFWEVKPGHEESCARRPSGSPGKRSTVPREKNIGTGLRDQVT